MNINHYKFILKEFQLDDRLSGLHGDVQRFIENHIDINGLEIKKITHYCPWYITARYDDSSYITVFSGIKTKEKAETIISKIRDTEILFI